MAKPTTRHLIVCIENEGFAAALEKRKIYVAVQDPKAEANGMMRIVDESGDDYLFPEKLFRAIKLPPALKKAIMAAA